MTSPLPPSPLAILEEMIEQQRAKLLSIAREFDPNLTTEDLLSPHDIPVLCRDQRFNFEDGVLAGLLSAKTALLAQWKGMVCQ